MKILLISDIHGNFPALEAVGRSVGADSFDLIINGGDITVYAPYPNETLNWLRAHSAVSILGNTDIKVLKLLSGKTFKKPSNPEKRIMYTWTAEQLTPENSTYLAGIGRTAILDLEGHRIGIFHGSPENDSEQLFNDTPAARFRELAGKTDCSIIMTGHSHSPYHKKINNVHFINPGSIGRMFDRNPDASYGVLELERHRVKVSLCRCPYDTEEVVRGLQENLLPPVYVEMFRQGKKTN